MTEGIVPSHSSVKETNKCSTTLNNKLFEKHYGCRQHTSHPELEENN